MSCDKFHEACCVYCLLGLLDALWIFFIFVNKFAPLIKLRNTFKHYLLMLLKLDYLPIFELFFCKKMSHSRRAGYVMDGSMDESVSQSVRDVCMPHQSDWIYYKQPIKFPVEEVNGM